MEAFLTYIPNLHPNAMLAFGMLLLLGVTGGLIANRIHLMPTITAFMLLGLLTGPHGLGLITADMMKDAHVIIDIALGLILYKLGNMLHPEAMLRSKRIMLTAILESLLTFAGVTLAVKFLGNSWTVAALIGAIAISSSPAVLVHVAEEMRAKGTVTSLAKSLVAMNNLFSFIVFSAVLPFAMAPETSAASAAILVPAYRLFGATGVGIFAAWCAVRIARIFREEDEHYRFVVVIGAVMVTLGVCSMLGMSGLFAPLVMGIATRWFESSKSNLSKVGFGEGGDLFFIALFVLAGAKIDLHALMLAGIAPVLLVAIRCATKTAGVFIASRFTTVGVNQAAAASLLIIPMAGMAIGLASTLSKLLPGTGAQVSALVFGMVAIFETIGPFAATRAFIMCGEAGQNKPAGEQGENNPG